MAFPTGINSANFNGCAQWNSQRAGNVTTVGTNGGPSAYGTRDQSGNVWEWNEETIEENGSFLKVLRGGAWNTTLTTQLSANSRLSSTPIVKSYNIGLRLVQFSGIYNFSTFVQIGDTGNAPDSNNKGSVEYHYDIMLHPVTNSEYTTFLNSVDPSGTNQYSLYSPNMTSVTQGGIGLNLTASNGSKYFTKANMATKPVIFVDWFCGARMCNWLHNNYGSTESGVYLLNGSVSGTSFTRSSGARFAIPTENEWYKAAYYKADSTNAGYWDYATQSDSAPVCVQANTQGSGPVVNALPTPTPTPTPTVTNTATPTNAIVPTPTQTSSVTPTRSPTTTPTNTLTPTPTTSVTNTPTPTITRTQTTTPTVTITSSPTVTPTKTTTKTPTQTPSVTKTQTPTPTNTPVPFATPSAKVGQPNRQPQDNMILDSLFNIKEYIGNEALSLINPICGSSNISDKQQLDIWSNFIENIHTIYATDNINGSKIVFSTIPSGQTFIPDPSSTLRSLVPNQSYYFILKQYPNKPIHIPTCTQLLSLSNDCGTNECPSIFVSGSGISRNGIQIPSGILYSPINISISGLDCDKNYNYRFDLKSASAPCSIYPLSGTLLPRNDSIANVSSIFEFGFDSTFIQQANLSSFLSNNIDDIFSVVEFIIEENDTQGKNVANYGYGNKTTYLNQPLIDVVELASVSNRNSSYYNIYDMAGQLYEWTDSSVTEKPNNKILLGGCWLDINPKVFSKTYKQDHDINSVFDDGGFGIRVCSYFNPYSYQDFAPISDTDHSEDSNAETCGFGQVSYDYMMKTNLVTNAEYCEFLNTVDPLGLNDLELYHYDMGNHTTGGILFDDCGTYGQKYILKIGMQNKPVSFISWLNAAKYTNWLHHNKGYETHTDLNNDAAASGWVSTAININTNNILDIRADGQIQFTDDFIGIDAFKNFTGPEGVFVSEIASETCGINFPSARFVKTGALLGKIGTDGDVFYIGSGIELNSNQTSGLLYLGIHDTGCALDNAGSFNVTLNLFDPNTIKDKILNGAYDLRSVTLDTPVYRSSEARYFLPSHREWYKAAYYDDENNKYWNYPTRSNNPPGKIKDVCYKTFNYPITISCPNCTTLFNSGLICPSITSLTNNILLTSASGDSVSIVANVSGLVIGSEYSYYFDTVDNNWPCNISPQSSSFIAKSVTQTISSVFTFANPKAERRQFANLPLVSDISQNFDDIYNIIKFNIAQSNSDCDNIERTSMLRCNDCYSKELVTTVAFAKPSNQTFIGVSGLPWAHSTIGGTSLRFGTDSLSNVLPYGSYVVPPPSDPYIWDNCDKYIPLIVTVVNHKPSNFLDSDSINNPISPEKYNFRFYSHADSVVFYPDAGTAYIANTGVITSLVKLNGNNVINAFVDIVRDSTGTLSRDSIGIRCLLADLPPCATPVTPTPVPTFAPTPTITPTPTVTPSPQYTLTPTRTVTPTKTPTVSVSPSASHTPSPTPTNTRTPSNTPTNTQTPSITPTNTQTPSITPTISLTPSITPTVSPSAPPANANWLQQANWDGSIYGNITTVGTNGKASAYGTYDQTGNVHEWCDPVGTPGGASKNIIYRGGSYDTLVNGISSVVTRGMVSSVKSYNSSIGFRIATRFPTDSIKWSLIRDPFNPSDSRTGFGNVNSQYAIAKLPVTVCEYVEFLNRTVRQIRSSWVLHLADLVNNAKLIQGITVDTAQSSSGTEYYFSVKPNYAYKPVTSVPYIHATRYCNWLHNNKPSWVDMSIRPGLSGLSLIDWGAYPIYSTTTDYTYGRDGDAMFFLPTENEWYKAAYFDAPNNLTYIAGTGKYWLYATRSDNPPQPITASETGDGPLPQLGLPNCT